MKRIMLLCFVASIAGCVPHFKEVDSYNTQFRDTYSVPDSVTPRPMAGDPYTFGGVAEGSGGLMSRQSYATDNDSPDFRDSTDTGKMGEIAKDRVQSSGALPGQPAATRSPAVSSGPSSSAPATPANAGKAPSSGNAGGSQAPTNPKPGG